jgi:ABC-type lipoprotein export system ATPase subunit
MIQVTHLNKSFGNPPNLRNQNIGFIFQFHYLRPELTAIENVLLPAFLNHQQKEYKVKAEALLETVGLSDKLNRYLRENRHQNRFSNT